MSTTDFWWYLSFFHLKLVSFFFPRGFVWAPLTKRGFKGTGPPYRSFQNVAHRLGLVKYVIFQVHVPFINIAIIIHILRGYHPTKHLRTPLPATSGVSGYFHHSQVPERISKTLPEVKLLLIVRDPTQRLISDYNQVILSLLLYVIKLKLM